MVKPMAQHSQPMRLPGRRARTTAPTVAKAKKGTQIATPTINSRVESPSLASRNAITSPSIRTTSSHKPQATHDAERGRMRSGLGDFTTLVLLRVSCWHMMAARFCDEEPPHADRPAAGDHR